MSIKEKIKGRGIQKLLLVPLFIIGLYDATAQAPKDLGEILSSKFDFQFQRHLREPDDVPVHFSWFPASDEEPKEVVCRSFVPADWEALKEVPGIEPFINWYESKHTSTDVVSSGHTFVSGSWLKFAFAIVRNANWEEGQYYTLMVDHLIFVVRAEEEGQVFNHAKILKAGYCGLPFLYVLPPEKTYIRYEPRFNNPLENLALYIDGFPVIDSIEDSGFSESESVTSVPIYEVELTLTGRFISEEGKTIAPFIKHVNFKTK